MNISDKLKKKCSINKPGDAILLKLFAYMVIERVIYIAVAAKCSIECILSLYIYIPSEISLFNRFIYQRPIAILARVDEVLSIKNIISILFFVGNNICSESESYKDRWNKISCFAIYISLRQRKNNHRTSKCSSCCLKFCVVYNIF